MKVALLHHRAIDRSGGLRHLLLLARELSELGIGVEVCFGRYDPDRAWPELTKGLDIRAVELVSDYEARRAPLYRAAVDQLSLRAMNRLISRDVSIVNPHEWGALAGLIGGTGGRPVVWMCSDANSWDYVNCGHPVAPNGRQLSKLSAKMIQSVERRFLTRRVNRVLCLDEQTSRIVRCGKGLRAHIIRIGVDADFFSPALDRTRQRNLLELSPTDFIVLGVGILLRHRRFEDLIAAFARLPSANSRLIIVGSDRYDHAYATELRELAQRCGVADRMVLITSQLPDIGLLEYYRAADVFVFPNEFQSWGMAVNEAMAVGLPVIVSSGAGVHVTVSSGSNGYVVAPRRADLIADELRRLQASPALRQRMGDAGRAAVKATLSWRSYATQMLAHFTDVLESPEESRTETHGGR